jgi:uncharacterized protein YecE (DUF72 family)
VLAIGTSGWQYTSWRGVLYPPGVPQRRWLERYAEGFDTVELNNAFYRLPPRETFEGWRRRTPDGFVMAVKASRYLTHVKRLRDPAEPVARLLSHAAGLGDRLGPVLLQLPPTLTADAGLLDDALAAFPPDRPVVVEPRHESWWVPAVRSVLERHGAALCWADRLGKPVTPTWRTADHGYLRLHEGTADPRPRYHRRVLRTWLDRLTTAFPDPTTPVYVYFNNDPGGAAILDAIAFAALAAGTGVPRTRVPTLPVTAP